METKNVKILFNTLSKYHWAKNVRISQRLSPLFEIVDILKHISKLSKKNKFRDLEGDKFCFLENYSEKVINGKKVILGHFKSARNEFRPNLINKKTGLERENPKLISEGDINKTHFAIILDIENNEVVLLLEYNYYGLTMKNILDYLKFFNGEYLKSKNLTKNYSLKYQTIAKDGFLEALQAMRSAKIAEVHFDKQLLGSNALNFSNRQTTLKQDLKLSIGAKIGESLKETAIDLFNLFNSGNSSISKVRISGRDEDNNDVLIDTSFMNKIEYLKVDKSKLTGELNATQIFTGFSNIINQF